MNSFSFQTKDVLIEKVNAEVLYIVITGKGNDMLMATDAAVHGGPVWGGGRTGVQTIRKLQGSGDGQAREAPESFLKNPVPKEIVLACFHTLCVGPKPGRTSPPRPAAMVDLCYDRG